MMTNEEEYLRSHIGTRNPFRVPEGYFDNFASQLMERLPSQPQAGGASFIARPSLFRRMRPLLYAAAFLMVAVISVTLYVDREEPKGQEAQLAIAQEAASVDAYLDEAADYAMLDNYDIYSCLASE